MEFDLLEDISLVQSTKIGTHENKAIYSIGFRINTVKNESFSVVQQKNLSKILHNYCLWYV